MPEPSLHADGHRAVASSKTGAQLFQGYRVRLDPSRPEPHPQVGIVAAITPDGDRVAVTWPTGDTTWHRGCNLIRWGSSSLNEQHPETKAGYPAPPPPWGESPPAIREQIAARDADEQRWVELTRSQVNALLSLVQERLALYGPDPGPDRSELLVLKGMLLIGRDDPGSVMT